MILTILRGIALAVALAACSAPDAGSPGAGGPPTEVVVMGMIHSGHRTSEIYGLDRVRAIVRAVRPDEILCEIPPDRLDTALEQYRTTGEITESRVRVFPEYVDAIIPMMEDAGFVLVPCAGWTHEMSDDRRAKLSEWRTTRPEESAEVEAAQDRADAQLAAEGLDEDPRTIHTERYDEIVRLGMEPYNRLFNDDLGPGGWDNINAAHFALISAAIDRNRGTGRRLLITFGAWHNSWFMDALRERDDIVLRNLNEFLDEADA